MIEGEWVGVKTVCVCKGRNISSKERVDTNYSKERARERGWEERRERSKGKFEPTRKGKMENHRTTLPRDKTINSSTARQTPTVRIQGDSEMNVGFRTAFLTVLKSSGGLDCPYEQSTQFEGETNTRYQGGWSQQCSVLAHLLPPPSRTSSVRLAYRSLGS